MIKILQGNALHLSIRDKSIHCIVTSSPYFGLRAYAGMQLVDWPAGKYSPCTGAPACIEVPDMRCGFGAEETAEAYIWHSLLILRECRRVLRDDGVMWYNLGDSYGGSNSPKTKSKKQLSNHGSVDIQGSNRHDGNLIGIPARLMLAVQADGWIVRNDCVWRKVSPMPESLAGSRWVKHRINIENGKRAGRGNKTMLENPTLHTLSKKDRDKLNAKYIDCPGCDECTPNGGLVLKRGSWRHTRSHEFVFMLTKQMQYFCDGDAVREKHSDASIKDFTSRKTLDNKGNHGGTRIDLSRSREDYFNPSGRNPRSVLSVDAEQEIAEMVEAYEFELRAALVENRNPSDVLSPKPSNYPGQHFATFPSDLIRNLIKSSTPKKCCPKCGAGYAPVVEIEKGENESQARPKKTRGMNSHTSTLSPSGSSKGWNEHGTKSLILGYRPTCECNAGTPVPGICLDPFVGSGTTLSVCRELDVNGIGIDISFPYLYEQATSRAEKRVPQEIQDKRIAELPLFSEPEKPFERIYVDARNGEAKLKTEIVE